jgi:hypothetical protein
MSDQPKEKRPVPEGKSRFMTTRQKKPTKTGYVGYEVGWEPFHKVADYTIPKRP